MKPTPQRLAEALPQAVALFTAVFGCRENSSPRIECRIDDDAIVIDGWVYLHPCEIPAPTGCAPFGIRIGAQPMRAGWGVTTAHPIAGTHWEPPDVDIIEHGEHLLNAALEVAYLLIAKNLARNYHEHQADIAYEKAMDAEHVEHD